MGEMVLVAFSGVCRFLLESLTDTELKLAYDVHFIQRSFQSAVCSCAAIHLVLMKGISNRSPLSTYRFFHCLQIEQDSLLWKGFLGLLLEPLLMIERDLSLQSLLQCLDICTAKLEPLKREKWISTIRSTAICIFKTGGASVSKWFEKWIQFKTKINTIVVKLTCLFLS